MGLTTKYPLLDTIKYPSDIKRLTINQLHQLCNELRGFIIEQLSNHPGHFASSLGTVELTVALHYVYDTPNDRIVWDVGHQAYGHKILTGRKDIFHTNRQFGGLSGFPNPDESEYDAFVAGHASNSISAALGMAVAAQLNHSSKHAVAVIGDGSMTGGLAYEALNNANSQKNNILIILNDNDMAIDKNVGGLRDYLVTMTTSNFYNRLRFCAYKLFKKSHLMSESRKNYVLRFNNSLKALLTKQHNLFEGFNIRYFGPVDGHDLKQLIRVLQNIKDLNGPKILHLHTIKGKGFKPAELSATEWHAPGKFDICTGKRIKTPSKDARQLYQDVFGHTLVELAKKDQRIMGVTPAMPTGCSMTYMMKEFPDRSFDVGIAEAHAVTYSAGLAKEGFVPFCNIYSSFMQRAYDQVIHDVAIQQLHVILCLDRAGLVGEDGATHHGAFDLSYMRCIPNLIIASPFNEHCLRNLMFTAVYGQNGPFVIRYPKGKGELKDWQNEMQILPIGKGRIVKEGADMAVLSLGNIGNTALAAIRQIEEQHPEVSIALYDLIFLKPLDGDLLNEIAKKFKKLVTIENGVLSGGMGSAVLEYFSDHGFQDIAVSRIGLPDTFVTHGSLNDLKKHCGLDVEGIAQRLKTELFPLV